MRKVNPDIYLSMINKCQGIYSEAYLNAVDIITILIETDSLTFTGFAKFMATHILSRFSNKNEKN